MTFTIPPSKKDEDTNRFHFLWGEDPETHEPRKYSLPLLKYLPVAAAEQFELGNQVQGLLLGADTEEVRDIIRGLDGDQFEAFMDQWQEASKTSVGESSAS